MVAEFGKELGVEKISLLPYHDYGKSKSYQIGKIYPVPDATAPDENHIQLLREVISKFGILTSVGN